MLSKVMPQILGFSNVFRVKTSNQGEAENEL